MKDGRAACFEELLYLIEVLACNGLKHTQTKRLRQRRGRSVKHRISTGDFDPPRAEFRKRLRTCFDKIRVTARFSSFQAAGQLYIGKWIFLLQGVSHSVSRIFTAAPNSRRYYA